MGPLHFASCILLLPRAERFRRSGVAEGSADLGVLRTVEPVRELRVTVLMVEITVHIDGKIRRVIKLQFIIISNLFILEDFLSSGNFETLL